MYTFMCMSLNITKPYVMFEWPRIKKYGSRGGIRFHHVSHTQPSMC